MEELYLLFKRNFPTIVRRKDIVENLLADKENQIFEKRTEKGKLVGVAVVNKQTVYLLCVDKKYRGKGYGNELLTKCENYVKQSGFDKIIVGVGNSYLTPGVPTNQMPFVEDLKPHKLFKKIDNTAVEFFKKRGYTHSWGESNCFDMYQKLRTYKAKEYKIGDTIKGINYNWATLDDLNQIVECVTDAKESFVRHYKNEKLYNENSKNRVIVAKDGKQVVGAVIVNIGTDGNKMGTLGCTAVKHSHRGNKIASIMCDMATSYFKELKFKDAFLSYTFTGLDVLYGYSNYKICVYYFMAEKKL